MTGAFTKETLSNAARAAKVINDLISERNILRAEIARLQAEVQRLERSQVRTVRSCEEFATDD